MRAKLLVLLLLLVCLVLGACRFAVVESGSVRIDAPTSAPAEAP